METFRSNVKFYLMEAAGLGGFVLLAGLMTIFLEHPELPVMQSSWKEYPLLRRIPLGLGLGVYVLMVARLFGKGSGAHVNPVVTWTFYRLGKISFKNAVLYTTAQFAGAILAAQILKQAVGYWFSHPAIDYGVTAPKPQYHSAAAFLGEFVISFLLMLVILLATASRRWEKKVPLLTGMLIALYLFFETPFSGMSMNPARSVAGDLAAKKFEHLWIYFVAPVTAMLLAAEAFLRIGKKRRGADGKELPVYPVQEKTV